MTNQKALGLLLDRLNDPEIVVRNMFGGEGIFRNGRMFALVYDGVLYLKMSDEAPGISNRPAFTPRVGRTFPSFRTISAAELEDAGAIAALSRDAQQAAAASSR